VDFRDKGFFDRLADIANQFLGGQSAGELVAQWMSVPWELSSYSCWSASWPMRPYRWSPDLNGPILHPYNLSLIVLPSSLLFGSWNSAAPDVETPDLRCVSCTAFCFVSPTTKSYIYLPISDIWSNVYGVLPTKHGGQSNLGRLINCVPNANYGQY